jgi:hypothetical protein
VEYIFKKKEIPGRCAGDFVCSSGRPKKGAQLKGALPIFLLMSPDTGSPNPDNRVFAI